MSLDNSGGHQIKDLGKEKFTMKEMRKTAETKLRGDKQWQVPENQSY
jgi:hypothetical protein